MATIGREAARAPLTSADINDGIVGAQDLQATLDLSSKAVTLPALSSLSVTGDLTVDTTTLYVDSTNNRVGMGTTSPSSILHLSSSNDPQITLTDTGFGASADITGSNGNLRLNSQTATIFDMADSEVARIDSSGNLLVGTTDTSPHELSSGEGVCIRPDSVSVGRTSQSAVALGRNGTDGNIAEFYKDGTTVGSIAVSSSDNLEISATQGGGAGLMFWGAGGTTPIISPMKTGSVVDAEVNLGRSSDRFKDLYLSGGVYLGGTGAANLLDDYEEGTFTPSITFGGNAVGVTYSTSFNRGWYTIVGRVVTLKMALEVSNKGSSTGALAIAVPFASTLTTASHAQKVHHNKINAISLAAYGTASTSTFGIYKAVASTTSSQAQITDADCGTSFSIIASITYMI